MKYIQGFILFFIAGLFLAMIIGPGDNYYRKKSEKVSFPLGVYLTFGFIGGIVGIGIGASWEEEEKKRKIAESERQRKWMIEEEERQKRAANAAQRQAELESLNYDYDQAVTNLRAAKIRLDEIQQFQLLRTASEKQQQVQGQLETIRSWENEVDRLKKEIDKY